MSIIEYRIKNISLRITIWLIVAIAVGSIYAAWRIDRWGEEDCYEKLEQYAKTRLDNIHVHISNDSEQLRVIARIMADFDELDCTLVRAILQGYENSNMISYLEILLPDHTLLTPQGERIDVSGQISFEEESRKGSRLTDRETEFMDQSTYVFRNCIPIVRDGEVKGILYGVVVLSDMEKQFPITWYNGTAGMYLVDGNTGDFLLDTWHDELGNISQLSGREVKDGYQDTAEMNKAIQTGQSGYIAMFSQSIQDYMYFYYMPADINNWALIISAPENEIFYHTHRIRELLYHFGICEAIFFIIYFVWMLHLTRRQTQEKQMQIDLISDIYDVEEMLFVAHRKKENIQLALKRVALMTGSDYAFFKIFGEVGKEDIFQWLCTDENPITHRISDEGVRFFQDYFDNHQDKMILRDVEEMRAQYTDGYELFRKKEVTNMVALPVKNTAEELIGVLGICNMKDIELATGRLEHVQVSFGMLYHNMESYRVVREMGEIDLLTKIHNRNSYQERLESYRESYRERIVCIYADVNGLHELNNEQGHAAGDKMLQCVAQNFKQQFGERDTYRIGGDEFVAFAMDRSLEEVREQVAQINQELAEYQYHASIGISCKERAATGSEDISMEELVKRAEQEMYQKKRQYYKEKGIERRSSF